MITHITTNEYNESKLWLAGGSCTPKSTEHQPALYTWHTLAQKCKTKSAWGNIQCEFDRSRCLDTKLDSKFILPTAFRSKFHKTGGGLSFGWVTTNKDQNNTERRFLFRPESASYLSEKFIAPFSVLPVVVSQVQFMSGKFYTQTHKIAHACVRVQCVRCTRVAYKL